MFSNIADAIAFNVSMDAYKIRAKTKGYEQTLPVYQIKYQNKQSPNEEEKDEQLFIRAFGNVSFVISWTEFLWGNRNGIGLYGYQISQVYPIYLYAASSTRLPTFTLTQNISGTQTKLKLISSSIQNM